MGLSYDRRVPDELLRALEPGGFAHSLVEFGGSGMWALDLQLRGLGAAKKQHRATLYVGTTKVVDLHLKGQSFTLSAHPTLAREDNGWVPRWAQWHHDRWFADQWTEVDNYLQMVIEKIVQAGTHVKEGMVQAALGRFPSTDFTVIDREAIVSFGSQLEKDACKSELAAKWLNALHRADPPAWWNTKPKKLGDECDVLAVSSRGDVLAIEVKPHTASDKDIAWSVLQAGMYADLFQRWADYAGGKAHEVLHDMAGQRNRIGSPLRRRRDRPQSRAKRERQAGGSARAPNLGRSCNRP